MNVLSNDYLILLLKIVASIPLILVIIKQMRLIREFKQYNGLAYSRNMLLFITIMLLMNSLVDLVLVNNFISYIFNVFTAFAFYKLYFNKHNDSKH